MSTEDKLGAMLISGIVVLALLGTWWYTIGLERSRYNFCVDKHNEAFDFARDKEASGFLECNDLLGL